MTSFVISDMNYESDIFLLLLMIFLLKTESLFIISTIRSDITVLLIRILLNFLSFNAINIDIQVKNDYLKIETPIDQEIAIRLCCLEIRRFFKDITQFALDKKSNFEYLEKDVGLHKFLPSSVITSIKVSILTTFYSFLF